MKVGVLTGGGDVPGLNPCIKAATLRAIEEGHEVVGVRRGWAGLLECDPDDVESVAANIVKLDPGAVRTIDRTGGTILHTSRTNPAKVRPSEEPAFLAARRAAEAGDEGAAEADEGPRDHTEHVLKVLSSVGIDAMIPIGGDDTLSFALRLHDEGFPAIAIPKTMDNDVHGTDYCIGFSTAVTRTVNFIHQLRTSAGSHERLAVVEVFGRYSGETSLVSAYLSGVERAIISEVPFDIERLASYLMDDKRTNPSSYAMMTISEGATYVGGDMVMAGKEDAYGHRKLGGIGQITGEVLHEITGEGIINQQLGYLMRSGSPDSLDLMVAINYAVMAVDLLVQGQTGRLVALRNGNYVNVPIDVTRQGVKRVDVGALYDVEAYRPKIRHVDGKPMFLY
ncbi:MAG TPA: 6-phosphofructokinase [Actinomycetota bacterium]|nr:6-phosphofructokinase [Actinomycetota bacterium]